MVSNCEGTSFGHLFGLSKYLFLQRSRTCWLGFRIHHDVVWFWGQNLLGLQCCHEFRGNGGWVSFCYDNVIFLPFGTTSWRIVLVESAQQSLPAVWPIDPYALLLFINYKTMFWVLTNSFPQAWYHSPEAPHKHNNFFHHIPSRAIL